MKYANETLALRDLVGILQTLCTERRTGTMFVHTDTNHSARIGMTQGRIRFIAFGRYRGLDAVEQLKKMQYGKYSFSESILKSGSELPLPPTPELLSQLAWAAVGHPPRSDGSAETSSAWTGTPPSRPAPQAGPPPAPPPVAFANLPLPGSRRDIESDGATLSVTGERLYRLVVEALALSIGPVASMVCDSYRDRLEGLSGSGEYRALVMRIASEVSGPDESARFVARALAAAGL